MVEHSPAGKNNPPRPESAASTDCLLCGLPLGDHPRILAMDGEKLSFCCRGCLHVFQILSATCEPGSDFRRTVLYGDCVAAGLIPDGRKSERLPAAVSPLADEESHASELTLRIEGMWCLSCAWVIEKVLGQTEGVLSAAVDFFADLLEVRYLPHRLSPAEIKGCLARLGYPGRDLDAAGTSGRQELLRLGIAAILAVNVMMLSFPLYGGFGRQLGADGLINLSIPLLLLTTPILFYSGWPILIRGLKGLASGNFTMDGLIAVGSLTAYFYSVYQMAHHTAHLYFDTAAMLITLVLLGHFIEQRARSGLGRGIEGLREVAAGKVRVHRRGRPAWIATATLKIGERFLVEPGEVIGADALVACGHGEVDEAILSGEPRPVAKKPGEEVLAGSRLLHGHLELAATRIGGASSVGRMLAMVREGLRHKNRLEELADHLTRRFVPVVFLLAGVTTTLLFSLGHTAEDALLRGLTVLIVSCPCALGIATPLAKVAIVGRAWSRGLVIRNTPAFEQARHIDTLVFDKTGTVTQGCFSLRSLHVKGCDQDEALARAGALEEGADHFLGRELRRLAENSSGLEMTVSAHCLHPGLGVSGMVAGAATGVGGQGLMTILGLQLPEELRRQATGAEAEGWTVVFLGWAGAVRAIFVFGDALRPGIPELMMNLKNHGYDIHLLSGDSPATTARIAARLGITNHAGGRRPEEKIEYIRALQAEGKKVAMIGDGFNDSGSLAAADLGVAVGGGGAARLLAEGADLTLLGDPVRQLPEVRRLSQLLAKAIRTNFAFAILYNTITIPVAALGWLNPLLAACIMFASSLTVIGNTLRLAARVGKDEAAGPEVVEGKGQTLPAAALSDNDAIS